MRSRDSRWAPGAPAARPQLRSVVGMDPGPITAAIETKDTVRVYGSESFQECLLAGSSKATSCGFGQRKVPCQTTWSRSEVGPSSTPRALP